MQLVVDGLLINYRRFGPADGRPVVILHGWADSSASWQAYAAQLADAPADGYAVYCIDLPGFGGSQAPADAWGLADYAHLLTDWLQKARIEPYAVIGHSNGGAIAIKAIAAGDIKPARLLLLASAGIRGQAAGRRRMLRYIAKAGKLASAPLPERSRQKLRHMLYRSAGSDMLVAEHMQASFKRVVAEDIRVDAGRLQLPTRLVYGDRDQATPLWYGQLLQQAIAGAELTVVPAGHFLQHDDLVGLLAISRKFLA